jgi:hypothetical protein
MRLVLTTCSSVDAVIADSIDSRRAW